MVAGVRDGGSRTGARCILTNERVCGDEVGMGEIATATNGSVDCFHTRKGRSATHASHVHELR